MMPKDCRSTDFHESYPSLPRAMAAPRRTCHSRRMLTETPAPSGPIDAELVVASDIHLRSLDDARGKLLLATIDRLAPTVRTLVLNGDVFDFCYGGGRYFRAKYA